MRNVLYILGSLADSDIEWLISAGQVHCLAPGQVLIEQGRTPDSLYILLKGSLAVTVSSPEPRELARVGPGEMMGEVSMLDSRPPIATVSAKVASQLLRIPRSRLECKLESDEGFAARFYRSLAVLLAQRMRQRTDLLSMNGKDMLDEEVETPDEIDPVVLDEVSLAGKRFEWILNRVQK